eukprot:2829355-Amphidinium_carterae.1
MALGGACAASICLDMIYSRLPYALHCKSHAMIQNSMTIHADKAMLVGLRKRQRRSSPAHVPPRERQ